MSLIVAARFTTFAEAENAARTLFDSGFQPSDVSIFFVNPPGMHHSIRTGGDEFADRSAKASHAPLIMGAAIGGILGLAVGVVLVMYLELSAGIAAAAGGIGAYAGSLIGAMSGMRSAPPQPHERGRSMDTRPSGVLLAAHVEAGTEVFASNLLRNQGGKDIERADGRWQDGKWADFNPVKPPVLSDKVAPSHA